MIKNKSKPWVLLGIALLMGTMSYAQRIHFSYIDGTAAYYNLKDVRKITFSADLMNLHLWDGSLYAWNVSTIGYYQYDETIINVEELLNNANAWDVKVFPNPASTTLNIQFNLPKADEIFISLHDMQGKLILEKRQGQQIAGSHQLTLDINSLAQGTYVCRISGQQNIITKQVIKQ